LIYVPEPAPVTMAVLPASDSAIRGMDFDGDWDSVPAGMAASFYSTLLAQVLSHGTRRSKVWSRRAQTMGRSAEGFRQIFPSFLSVFHGEKFDPEKILG